MERGRGRERVKIEDQQDERQYIMHQHLQPLSNACSLRIIMPAEEELTFADRLKLSIFFFQLFGHNHLQLILHLPGHKGWAPTGLGLNNRRNITFLQDP